MTEPEMQWNAETLDALRIMYRSHPVQVSCQRIERAIMDRKEKIREIDAESGLPSEEATIRAGLRARMKVEIRKFKKLAALKSCPETSD